MQQPQSNPLGVQQMYRLVTQSRGAGVPGYFVEKKYLDPLKQIQERGYSNLKKGGKNRKHVTKRGNYLDDQAKIHKVIPGPGEYQIDQEWPQKILIKKNYADKKTYIDQIMKREKREKKPAPGFYNLQKTLKEIEKDNKILAAKKIQIQDRISYLDSVQYEANLTPGVGNYNPRQRAKTQVTRSALKTKPEEWPKKNEIMQKKKPLKTPDVTTYNPQPSDFTTFDTLSKVKHNKNFFGKVERFRTSSSGSGVNPTKYNIIQEWKGKDNASTNSRHGLEVLSKWGSKSVYYH